MKLRLILKTTTKKGKEVKIKFNIAPSKHIGFINFINLAISQNNPISISFEKISKTGERDESKIQGNFSFESLDPKSKQQIEQIEQEIEDSERIRKKQAQKRKKT